MNVGKWVLQVHVRRSGKSAVYGTLSFDFGSVSKRTALAEMIGNAVPSKLSYVLGVELLR